MDFEALRELVSVITRNKLKQIEVFGNPGETESRTELLYHAIAKEKVVSDESAAKKFFETENAKDPNYKKLRNKLVRQLINSAFFVDLNQPMFNERSTAEYNCYRDFAAAMILRTRHANKAAAYLMEQTLEQSIKFEFTSLTAEILRFLRAEYSRSQGNRTEHAHFSELHKEYESKRYLELKATDYYEELVEYYLENKSPNEGIGQRAEAYYNELAPLAEKVDTARFFYLTFQIGIIHRFATHDYPALLKLISQAQAVLSNRKNINRSEVFSVTVQKIGCFTQLKPYPRAEVDQTYTFCKALIQPFTFNWFKLEESFLYYLLHHKHYDEALEVYAGAMAHQDRFETMATQVRESWNLFGGYFHLLSELGICPEEKVRAAAGDFKYTRFINDFELLDRDRLGMNIPLVLLPILFSIAKKQDLEEAYGRSLDSLEKYRKRYLDNDINQRSAAFMNLLLALSRLPFDTDSARRKIEKELAKLHEQAPQVAGQSFAVEIIPYEDLWNLLKDLKSKEPGFPEVPGLDQFRKKPK